MVPDNFIISTTAPRARRSYMSPVSCTISSLADTKELIARWRPFTSTLLGRLGILLSSRAWQHPNRARCLLGDRGLYSSQHDGISPRNRHMQRCKKTPSGYCVLVGIPGSRFLHPLVCITWHSRLGQCRTSRCKATMPITF